MKGSREARQLKLAADRLGMIRLDRRVPFVDAVLSGDTESAAALLRDAEQRHGLRFAVLTSYMPEDNRDEWYASHLWPFLSDTQFVVTAGDLFGNNWSLIDDSSIDHTPSWRQWGGEVADWANRHWFGRPGGRGPWMYMDFYMDVYLESIVEGYREWRNAILRVLDRKEGRSDSR